MISRLYCKSLPPLYIPLPCKCYPKLLSNAPRGIAVMSYVQMNDCVIVVAEECGLQGDVWCFWRIDFIVDHGPDGGGMI